MKLKDFLLYLFLINYLLYFLKENEIFKNIMLIIIFLYFVIILIEDYIIKIIEEELKKEK
jgi:hypothetical protein